MIFKLQIRYAALDAYCILELYKRCQKWAKKLGVDIKHLATLQDKVHANLPLFWESTQSLSAKILRRK